MYLAIKEVQPADNYMLILTFENGDKRKFDMKPYLHKDVFYELNDVAKFKKVRISFDTIEWENEADIDPEVLYNDSEKICD